MKDIKLPCYDITIHLDMRTGLAPARPVLSIRTWSNAKWTSHEREND